jgi:RNA polymerase sigma factor (sigma-70 family)
MIKTLAPQSDRELLAACLKGDPAAWETLIVRYQRLIYSIPIKIGLSPNDAADVFQAVCVKLLEGLPALRNQERISAWLTTTTKRECWRFAARRRREHLAVPCEWGEESGAPASLAASAPPADQQQEALEQQQILREAVALLPERCRHLITMLFYGDGELSYVEIARRLNMPLNSIGATRARCLAKLKKLLEGKL